MHDSGKNMRTMAINARPSIGSNRECSRYQPYATTVAAAPEFNALLGVYSHRVTGSEFAPNVIAVQTSVDC